MGLSLYACCGCKLNTKCTGCKVSAFADSFLGLPGAVLNNFATLVDALITSEMHEAPQHEKLLLVCDTPEYLRTHASFPALPVAVKSSIISKICFDHGIPTRMIQQLPTIIQNAPMALFKPAKQTLTDSVVVVTFEIKNGAPVIIPIRKNQQVGRNQYYNLVTSMYGKEGPDPVQKWEADGLLIWKSQP
ncbi:hypothetical protein WH50_03340 [Pokkaliibacter plantistimulans]|uniref:Phage MuF C-terminal domain-containing protein n=1 Tax=Pokkaliibacter plantistimulans TaxID=1635171 RepID=A0ABX5M134_9GAMM|nr:hypothetical protein [Pokkaliibacter plantistimulans]PXF32629.1 hypothetical protein WH50_03340 [Pokkaliibacter plantistimulans]